MPRPVESAEVGEVLALWPIGPKLRGTRRCDRALAPFTESKPRHREISATVEKAGCYGALPRRLAQGRRAGVMMRCADNTAACLFMAEPGSQTRPAESSLSTQQGTLDGRCVFARA